MKTITLILVLACALSVSAQPTKQDSVAKDSIVQTTMKLNDYRALLYTIDQNVDSKKVSKEIIAFIDKQTRLVKPAPVQPADKPKKK